ncbi:MAG: monofunctional biosynthetic peptidoglycan transglycosylase, partial [Polaromonas sp.]|nr:monofunctional biosynthetic peptidoglycan transglycosylase [Polaromonas sp.]
MKALLRWLLLVLIAGLAVQLYFVGRIALMALVDPQSTAFQRSEMYRLATEKGSLKWRQQWVPYAALSDNLKRAVIVS